MLFGFVECSKYFLLERLKENGVKVVFKFVVYLVFLCFLFICLFVFVGWLLMVIDENLLW